MYPIKRNKIKYILLNISRTNTIELLKKACFYYIVGI